jgi:hypothetical protein
MKESSSFFVAYHTLRDPSKSGEWWAEMADAQLSKAAQMQLERGIYSHLFMPTGSGDGPILVLCECREPTSTEALRAFLEGPARPAGDALNTRVHAVDVELPGLLPQSAWSNSCVASSQLPRYRSPPVSTGSFFWATHTFVDDSAATSFWSWARENDISSPHPGLLHHHCFLPTGATEGDPVFSVWETREPLGADEFQRFLDGPNSPVAGLCTSQVNELTGLCMSQAKELMNLAVPPPAAFPRRPGSFAGSMMMPLMDDGMQSMNNVMGMLRSFQRHAISVDDDEFEPAQEQLLYGSWTKTPECGQRCTSGRCSQKTEETEADADDAVRKIESVMPFKIETKRSPVPVRKMGGDAVADDGADGMWGL